jgi:hypothetical protein
MWKASAWAFSVRSTPVAKNYGVDAEFYCAELSFAAMYQVRGAKPVYQPLPRFPSINRDIAIVCDASIPVARWRSASSVTIRLQTFQRSICMAETKTELAEGLVYKGHPLRRVDNLIYYGTMAEKYIIMMQIMDTKKVQDMEVATKVSVQLQLTDPELRSRDRIVKRSEKDSLYAAMDVAAIWLDRALAGKEK